MILDTARGQAWSVRCSGLIKQTRAFMQPTKENGSTNWNDQYLRLVMRFDIGVERYHWLNTSLFIAKGRLFRMGSVACEGLSRDMRVLTAPIRRRSAPG